MALNEPWIFVATLAFLMVSSACDGDSASPDDAAGGGPAHAAQGEGDRLELERLAMVCPDDVVSAARSGQSVCLDQGLLGGTASDRCEQELQTSGWVRDLTVETAVAGTSTVGREASPLCYRR